MPRAARVALGLSLATLLVPAPFVAACGHMDNEAVVPAFVLWMTLTYWWLLLAIGLRDNAIWVWKTMAATLVLFAVLANASASLLTCVLVYVDRHDWPVEQPGTLAGMLGILGSIFTFLAWRFWRLQPRDPGAA